MWFTPEKIEKACSDMKELEKEQLRLILPDKQIILVNGSYHRIFVEEYSIIEAVLNSGFKDFCIIHNHPSGNCNPSEEDKEFTKVLNGLSKRNGINLIDHVIIESGFTLEENVYLKHHGCLFETDLYSFKKNGLICD